MTQEFAKRPEECSHEHLTPAAAMNDQTHIPRFFTMCSDCGMDMTLLPAFLRARAEEDVEDCDGANEYSNCAIFSRRRILDAKAKIALADEYEDFFSVAYSDDRTDQRVTLLFALEHLAAAYKDHPDYQIAWAPYEGES